VTIWTREIAKPRLAELAPLVAKALGGGWKREKREGGEPIHSSPSFTATNVSGSTSPTPTADSTSPGASPTSKTRGVRTPTCAARRIPRSRHRWIEAPNRSPATSSAGCFPATVPCWLVQGLLPHGHRPDRMAMAVDRGHFFKTGEKSDD
jgi:hypothetical protein